MKLLINGYFMPVLLVILWPYDTTLINIFQKALKISQFADDNTPFNSNRNSIKRGIYVLDNFGNLLGLRLHLSETKALWLGLWMHCKEKPLGFQWPKKPVQILGPYVPYLIRYLTKQDKMKSLNLSQNSVIFISGTVKI